MAGCYRPSIRGIETDGTPENSTIVLTTFEFLSHQAQQQKGWRDSKVIRDIQSRIKDRDGWKLRREK